jgi:hypothetical protein
MDFQNQYGAIGAKIPELYQQLYAQQQDYGLKQRALTLNQQKPGTPIAAASVLGAPTARSIGRRAPILRTSPTR